ncbi:hypothetical protein FBU59_005360 [Linderina macrospora]|uniref:Uncharacterized protein n=1 Tax=Linderina macrospora TaxID=4868 RepID=A0ACC1J2R8_9FUNG|nr:hypothetical protein FBU59_005360 [Linderina macrospora]
MERAARILMRQGLQASSAGMLARRAMSTQKANVYGEYQFKKSIQRGRQQYMIKNVLTAFGLGGLCTAIYFYSLNVVQQEDFSDVPMPPEPTAAEKSKFDTVKKN